MTSMIQKGICSDRVRGPSSVNVDLLECPICHDLLWIPVACQTCETSFCSTCIDRWLADNPEKCPNRCDANIATMKFSNLEMLQREQTLIVGKSKQEEKERQTVEKLGKETKEAKKRAAEEKKNLDSKNTEETSITDGAAAAINDD
ncbi:unnamed protein product [Rotaria sordida]|uniref:RING-type domain-containing protein n=2 Tax=Rotaria sordida TaxID=392033 RepID=A0A813YTH2_9BILA|nr:unnamed protein product [Rotaria sordida]